jgi:hypothetical protein
MPVLMSVLVPVLVRAENCPHMLLPGRSGRIVFVGHSAGGLMIRRCLEVRE